MHGHIGLMNRDQVGKRGYLGLLISKGCGPGSVFDTECRSPAGPTRVGLSVSSGLSSFPGPWARLLGFKLPLMTKDLMPQVFPANSDPETPVMNLLPEPQVARFIRLLPQTWLEGGAACLRAEILACPVSGGQSDEGWMDKVPLPL